jgi:hypothetical protein
LDGIIQKTQPKVKRPQLKQLNDYLKYRQISIENGIDGGEELVHFY